MWIDTHCHLDAPEFDADRDAVRSRVGLLGHRNGLYGDLTVADNVAFWGATVGASDAEVAASLERLGLAGRLAGHDHLGQQHRRRQRCRFVPYGAHQ